MPHRYTVCTVHAALHCSDTQHQMSQETGNFPMQQTCNLDTVSPLRAPLLTLSPLHPHDTSHWLKAPPLKSKFPFAARSAECCCLLCTQKFAEAVSCPQTSAPWSGVGEERQGLDWCACCSVWLCQNVWCMDLYMFVCMRVWVNNYSNRCFVSFWALYW